MHGNHQSFRPSYSTGEHSIHKSTSRHGSVISLASTMDVEHAPSSSGQSSRRHSTLIHPRHGHSGTSPPHDDSEASDVDPKKKKLKKAVGTRDTDTILDAALETKVRALALRYPYAGLDFDDSSLLSTANGRGQGGRQYAKLAVKDRVLRAMIYLEGRLDGKDVPPPKFFEKGMGEDKASAIVSERLKASGLRTEEEVELKKTHDKRKNENRERRSREKNQIK